jgi:hypothetical protein
VTKLRRRARGGDARSAASDAIMAAQLAHALTFALICGDLPADCRRALLRHELATMDNAAAEEFFERVTGRLDYADPLIMLMQAAS